MSLSRVGALLSTLAITVNAASAQASRVLVMDAHGHVHARQDPFVTPAPPDERRVPVRAHTAAAPRAVSRARTPKVLRALLQAGQIDQPTYDRALGDFKKATQLANKFSGSRAAALKGVIADLEGMAARGAVVPRRLPALMATLEANIKWWSTGPLLANGARVTISGSSLVWQHYIGHGIQIQWLGTWGKANGLYYAKDNTALADLVGEAVSLAGPRAGGDGYEYLFPFDGGRPPWVSGLAQGAALTALVRAGGRLHDGTWYQAARRAVAIYRKPPPEGVAEHTAAGTHYLQYSYAPRLHIMNGFIEALNGLFDYAKVLKDAEGLELFKAGRAEAAVELPHYDTGGWSRYDQHSDSDLHYHGVLRDFLALLCQRLQKNKLDDEPFCKFAARFTEDLTDPPVVRFPRKQAVARPRRTARVRFSIDKPGTVTLVITRGRFTHRAVVPVASGAHSFGWRPPAAGTYTIRISATDLAGNSSTTNSAATVRR